MKSTQKPKVRSSTCEDTSEDSSPALAVVKGMAPPSRNEPIITLERLDGLLHGMKVGILVQGADAEILVSNQAAIDLLGLTEDQLLGKTSFDPDWNVVRADGSPFPGEEHPVPRVIATHRAVRDVVMGVYRPGTKDRIWLLVNAEPILTNEGRLSEVMCTFGKNAEERLQERERLYRGVVEGISDALFILRPDAESEWQFTFANSACLAMLGQTAEAMLGKRMQDLLPAEQARLVVSKCVEAVNGRQTIEYEDTLEIPNGTMNLVTRLTPIFDETDRCVEIIGASRNITEQKTAERTLRKTNRRLVNILESTHDAFLSVDREWRVTYMNPKAEQLCRRSRSMLLGKNLWEEFPQGVETKCYEALHRALAKQVSVELEEHFELCGLSLHINGFPSQNGLSIYAQDITDRVRIEEKLRHSVEQLRLSMDGAFQAMSYMVETRDPFTAGHQKRVSLLATAIARELRLPDDQLEIIRMAGLIHDIGKIAVPAEILSKPGHLSDPEMSLIRIHPQVGYDILKGIDLPPAIALVALQHHERLDGSGYPNGLSGEQTILEARIMAVADVVEAMASHRPYRPALGIEKALNEVLTKRDTRYDESAVEACLSVFTRHGFDFDQLMKAES